MSIHHHSHIRSTNMLKFCQLFFIAALSIQHIFLMWLIWKYFKNVYWKMELKDKFILMKIFLKSMHSFFQNICLYRSFCRLLVCVFQCVSPMTFPSNYDVFKSVMIQDERISSAIHSFVHIIYSLIPEI